MKSLKFQSKYHGFSQTCIIYMIKLLVTIISIRNVKFLSELKYINVKKRWLGFFVNGQVDGYSSRVPGFVPKVPLRIYRTYGGERCTIPTELF